MKNSKGSSEMSNMNMAANTGHVHVTVDDNSWYFVHSNNDPVVLAGLSPGDHKVKLELVGPDHKPTGASQTVNFKMAGS